MSKSLYIIRFKKHKKGRIKHYLEIQKNLTRIVGPWWFICEVLRKLIINKEICGFPRWHKW